MLRGDMVGEYALMVVLVQCGGFMGKFGGEWINEWWCVGEWVCERVMSGCVGVCTYLYCIAKYYGLYLGTKKYNIKIYFQQKKIIFQ